MTVSECSRSVTYHGSTLVTALASESRVSQDHISIVPEFADFIPEQFPVFLIEDVMCWETRVSSRRSFVDGYDKSARETLIDPDQIRGRWKSQHPIDLRFRNLHFESP